MEAPHSQEPRSQRLREAHKILNGFYPKHNLDRDHKTFFGNKSHTLSHKHIITVKDGTTKKLRVELTRSPFSEEYFVRRVVVLHASENEAAKNLVKTFKDAGYQGVLRRIKLIEKEKK